MPLIELDLVHGGSVGLCTENLNGLRVTPSAIGTHIETAYGTDYTVCKSPAELETLLRSHGVEISKQGVEK